MLTTSSAKAPATLTAPPPAPAVAFAEKSSRSSPPVVTSAFTVVGPFAVPATVAVLVTFARLIETAAPIASGGARAAVAVPSAFAFASVSALDHTVIPPAPTVTPVGMDALEVVLAMLTAMAAATLIVPPEVCAGGVAGSEPLPVALLFDATLLPKVRCDPFCASGDDPPPPLDCEPFALEVALAVVAALPAATSSNVPAVVSELFVVAVTVSLSRPRASEAPTAAFAP